MTDVSLGDVVRCRLTGFQGVAAAITIRLYGSTSVWVQPEGLVHGEPLPAKEFVQAQLEIVDRGWISEDSGAAVNSTVDPLATPPHLGR